MALPSVHQPKYYDLNAYQGSTFVWSFNVEYLGQAVDLSNTVVSMTIKRQRGKNVPVVWQGSTATTGVAVGVAVNKVTVNIPAAEMDDFPAGSLVYELDFTEGIINYTYLTGQFVVGTEVDN
jgi:hypothetical protein